MVADPRPVPALPDRQPARRPGPHGALQLGVRPPPRRHLRAPHRGHRRRPQHPGVVRRPVRPASAGSGSTGTRAPTSAARTRRTASPSAATSTATPWSGCAAGGHTYRCYCTTDEVAARRQAAGSKDMGYDGFCRDLSAEQVAAFEAEGRAPGDAVPDARGRRSPSTTWCAAEVTFHSDHVPDYVLARANGDPLYTLVNPVDDALMGITHVLRGEDLLSSTPRQIAAVRRPRRGRPRLRRRRASATCPTSWARATRSSPSATPRRTRSPTATRASCPRGC